MTVAAAHFYGTLPLSINPRRESEGEDGALDSVSQDYLVAWPGWRAALSGAGVVKNALFPGYTRMFVAGFEVEQEDDTRAIVSVRGTGILHATGDKRVREISSQGRIVSLGPIGEEGSYESIVTPSGSGERWNINEPDLSLTDTYFTTTKPTENVQGTALTPPSPPAAPVYQWAGYSGDLRFNHPNGWVIDQRNSTEIIPGQLWAVRDFYVFYQSAIPA